MAFDQPRGSGDAVDGAIGAIYDAAMAADAWPRALGCLKGLFDLGSTAYVVHDMARTAIRRATAEYDPEGQRANVESLLRGSIFYKRAGVGRPGEIVRTASVAPLAVFRRSTMYREYWRPRDLHDGLRLTVDVESSGTVHAINLIRTRSAGDFEPRHIALAQRLMPHLRRAIAMRRRLGSADLLMASALHTLDLLPHGILLLNRRGRVVHANAAASALLTGEDGLRTQAGLLAAAGAPATHRLHALLAAAAGSGGASPRAGALRLPRPLAGTPLALLAMPFRQDTDWTLPDSPAVLAVVSDPYAGQAPAERHLAALFGLTAAEAALASSLLAGLGLGEIAARTGRGLSTVRTLLARLMAKAEVGRQTDLLRVLGAVPRFGEPV